MRWRPPFSTTQSAPSRQLELNAMREALAGQTGSVAQLAQVLDWQDQRP